MDSKIVSLLKKIYFHENGFYNAKEFRNEYHLPDNIAASDLSLLKKSDFLPNNFELFEHDQALDRFLELKKNPKLTLDFVTTFFIKRITGEFVRGRQPLMSFLYLQNLSQHTFVGKDYCNVYGLPQKKIIDKTHQLYTFYLGHSWNEQPLSFLIDLEEISLKDKRLILASDLKHLKLVFETILSANESEMPGQLEKRLASTKVLSNTDKYKRYGILQTLAECGILPNDRIKPKHEGFTNYSDFLKINSDFLKNSRSDIVLPLAGWKGENRINNKRVKELFTIEV